MKKVKLSRLVLDFQLYPRADVDGQHVHYLCEALAANCELPPIIVDKASYRVVDGFHRVRAYRREFGPDAEIMAIEKTYGDDAEIFADAMRYNAAHGRTLTTHDRTHCILKAEQFKLTQEAVASALHLSVEAVGDLRAGRVGKLRGPNQTEVALKRTIRHMAGRTMTKAQQTANDKLSGMDQLFYVNQLIILLENGLLDIENEKLMDRLPRLYELLETVTTVKD